MMLRPCMFLSPGLARTLLFVAALLWASAAYSQDQPADVALVMDSSVSMGFPGMDPDHHSLLVAKLLSDLVPGHLAVIRLLDLERDKNSISIVENGGPKVPCQERPGQMCNSVTVLPESFSKVHQSQAGLRYRNFRGDADFKKGLDDQLAPIGENSPFPLAFEAAMGWFEKIGGASPPPRLLIWVSDGTSDLDNFVVEKLNGLKAMGVTVIPLLFGANASEKLVNAANLKAIKIQTAGELMGQFASVFRQIIGAPYQQNDQVGSGASIPIHRGVEEAWVITYGNASLQSASLTGPGGTFSGDYAMENHPQAGAYRVVHVTKPTPGMYTLTAKGGGSDTAFAVVESFNIIPHIVQPKDATSGVPTRVTVELLRRDGARVDPADLPPDIQLEASFDSATTPLTRDSQGTWSAEVTFRTPGSIPLHARVFSKVYVDRTVTTTVQVRGEFQPTGGPYVVDFKTLKAGSPPLCVPVSFSRRQQGPVSMSVEKPSALPAGIDLELQPSTIEENKDANLCLVAGQDAPNSRETQGAAAQLVAKFYPGKQVPLIVRWDVRGLTWWEHWRRLILILLGIVLAIAIALGWILPHRWPRGMAVACAPTLADLDLQKPVPITTFSGVGIGFYRDARAFIHSNFRVSGKRDGALVVVTAARRGVVIESLGPALFRTDGGRGWDEIKGSARRGAMGEPYRIGEKGPYFRLQTRRRV